MGKKWIKIKETGQLYLEKIIVSFDVPILFVCNDFENRKYICLNVDDENGTTVIAETDNKMLISMLKDIITMESVFRNASDNRIIIAEYDAENEEIITKIENAEEVSESLLPDEGALLELSNENISEYISFLEKQLIRVEVEAFCEKYIYQATVDAMAKEGRPFTGVIFFGLMLTEDGPKVLEYNARFGDPEAQVVLPRMKNDIIDVMEACVDGTLDTIDLQFEDNACVCVVLASDGYPVKYEKGFKITGFEKFDGKDDYYCYHAGTKFDDDGNIVTNGGRVLGITATGATLKEARAKAYEATEWVQFDNKYMRHDIGKAIDEA